jgi:hypothetical protein
MASECAEILRPYSKMLRDAVAHYLAFLRTRAASKPLDTFLAEYCVEIECRVAAGSLRAGALKAIIGNLCKELKDRFGSALLSDITAVDLAAGQPS